MSRGYWIKVEDQVYGPYSSADIRERARTGGLQPDQAISVDQVKWYRAREVKSLVFAQPDAAPPAPSPVPSPHYPEAPSTPQYAPAPAPAAHGGYDAPSAPTHELLQGSSLDDWDLRALDACRWASEVRSSMVVLGVLLVLNVIVSFFLLGHGKDEVRAIAMLNLGGFVVMAVLAGITYAKPNFAMVLTTAICVFIFACGCLTAFMAIALLAQLGKIRRAESNYPLTLDRWKAIKQLLKRPSETLKGNWIKVGRWWWVGLYDNKALLLIGNAGKAFTIDRHAAANAIEQKRSKYRINGWVDMDGKALPLKITCDESVAQTWTQWAGASRR